MATAAPVYTYAAPQYVHHTSPSYAQQYSTGNGGVYYASSAPAAAQYGTPPCATPRRPLTTARTPFRAAPSRSSTRAPGTTSPQLSYVLAPLHTRVCAMLTWDARRRTAGTTAPHTVVTPTTSPPSATASVTFSALVHRCTTSPPVGPTTETRARAAPSTGVADLFTGSERSSDWTSIHCAGRAIAGRFQNLPRANLDYHYPCFLMFSAFPSCYWRLLR
ncbi:hypothetical protein A0H81_03527 [Grifola frondosa]|uniref:Uncharacterized protein n=1 Tax=Grifola frondosa TaxID=5627 RepID=A0A1C7MJS7_GRIFR|nr:hypothetical protein A0H81_03527 [Grifola frondosa]